MLCWSLDAQGLEHVLVLGVVGGVLLGVGEHGGAAPVPHDSLIYHTRGLPVVIGDCEGQQWLEARLDLAVPI